MKNESNTVLNDNFGWVDYAQGVAWGTLGLFVFVIISYIALALGIHHGVISLGWGAVGSTFLAYLSFTVAHDAGHGSIAHEVESMKGIEKAVGWIASIPFLVLPYGLFTRIHAYHHAYTNDPERDPDHWVSGDSLFKVSLRAITLPFNYLYLTATDLFHDPLMAKTHKSSLVYFAVTLAIATTFVSLGYGEAFLIVGVLPVFAVSFVLGMLFDWIPHTPTQNQGRYQNTRTYLFPGLNFITMGQSYHHIHHLYPRVAWYHYHKVFKAVRPELEANNAPIEQLFSEKLPGFLKASSAYQPGNNGEPSKLSLVVKSIKKETQDSVVITFDNMNDEPLEFEAGQYVTLSKKLEGVLVTRCYSICESTGSARLSIGVKKVSGGVLSNFLNDQLKVGDQLTVAGPFGEFIYQPAQSRSECLVLIAGGSGITPILSIAATALEQNPLVQVHLIYASRSIVDQMFVKEVNYLAFTYPDNFKLTMIYKTGHAGWAGDTGYLDEIKLTKILGDKSKDNAYYVCGPVRLKAVVEKTLTSMNIGESQIFIEEFTLQTPKPKGQIHQVKVSLDNGDEHQFGVAENQTVLQVAQQKGIALPSACGVGQCGCCMMEIKSGSAGLASNDTPGLLPGEKARGLTLSCQCRPESDLTLSAKLEA